MESFDNDIEFYKGKIAMYEEFISDEVDVEICKLWKEQLKANKKMLKSVRAEKRSYKTLFNM